MKNLYTLQIGINRYHPDSNVPQLAGCINDVQNMTDFLHEIWDKNHLHRHTLLNEAATYENIVRSFGEVHLLKAQKDDVVLVQYSGHGARESAATAFAQYYPDGKGETLVCYDSRVDGGLDLADKELAVLIDRISQKGAEVVVILDCCHSGSGTREIGDMQMGMARQWEDREQQRTLKSYLNGHFVEHGTSIPDSQHILLAACDKEEKAFELRSRKGHFTTTLLKILRKVKGNISYANLFAQCQIKMLQKVKKQHPQFDPRGYFNPYGSFFGLGSADTGVPIRVFFDDNQWRVNSGALNGLPSNGKPAIFEIYKDDKPIGHAKTLSVGIQKSILQAMDFELDKSKNYQAKLFSMPIPPSYVYLQADEEGGKRIATALQQYKPLFFNLNDNTTAENSDYTLLVTKDTVSITRNGDYALIRSVKGNDEEKVFMDAFATLEHLCRWERTLALDNKDTHFDRQKVELVLVYLDEQDEVLHKSAQDQAIVDIPVVNDVEQKVRFRLEVRNYNDIKLHFALAYFSEKYGIFNLENRTIAAKDTVIIIDKMANGNPYSFDTGRKKEATDIFKLYVSTEAIDTSAMFSSRGFDIGETVEYWTTRDLVSTTGLLAKGIGLDENEQSIASKNDWFTKQLTVKSIAVENKISNQTLSLSQNKIKILGHETLSADVNFLQVNRGSRNIESMSIFDKLATSEGATLFQFGDNTRSTYGTPNLLEINNIKGNADLEKNPLQIAIDADLNDNETLLPLTFDGEHILLVGDTEVDENGQALVSISQIPEIIEEHRRSITKALKLCFMKIVLRQNPQYLRWVDYNSDEIVRHDYGLINKVKNAKNILLLIHGIIGDTKNIAESMQAWYEKDKENNLVLTFDYENLNTSIGDTALALQDKLAEIGIDENSKKKITILAHSMGGLVSRHFIEKLNGSAIVKHLIMAGTPNAGSAVANVLDTRKYIKMIFTFAVNFGWAIPYAASVLSFLKFTHKLTPTLEQMHYNSDFLQELNLSADPHVPYSIVAGHLDRFIAKNQEAQKLIDKLYKSGADLFYKNQANDIAVAIDSILSIDKNREPSSELREVACHHLNYFLEPESTEALYQLLTRVVDDEMDNRIVANS